MLRLGGGSLPTHELQAEAKDLKTDTPMKIVQWVRFGPGAFVRMVGVALGVVPLDQQTRPLHAVVVRQAGFGRAGPGDVDGVQGRGAVPRQWRHRVGHPAVIETGHHEMRGILPQEFQPAQQLDGFRQRAPRRPGRFCGSEAP